MSGNFRDDLGGGLILRIGLGVLKDRWKTATRARTSSPCPEACRLQLVHAPGDVCVRAACVCDVCGAIEEWIESVENTK